MSTCKGFAAAKAGAPLGPYSFERREAREHDVVIDIKYCGICHSDIHQARDQWSEYQEEAIFPMVPGHEIAGIVTRVGLKSRSIRWATRLELAALWTHADHALNARPGLNSTAACKPSGPITRATRKDNRPMADIRSAS
jgi:uncharacterized zinc-type alcohol dehydrogenase-like protein